MCGPLFFMSDIFDVMFVIVLSGFNMKGDIVVINIPWSSGSPNKNV